MKIDIPKEILVPVDLVGEAMKRAKKVLDEMAIDCAKKIDELHKNK